MAKINRITGNVDAFAKDALGTERTVFGGVTQSDDLNDQINDEFKRGWGIVGPSEFPKIQDFNAVGFTVSMLSAYLYQMGVAEWTGYQQYQVSSVVNTPDGIFICKTSNHTSITAPKDDASNWYPLVSQDLGASLFSAVSQKTVTDELNRRLLKSDVLGFTGTSTTAVMSQKIVTDELALRLAQHNIKQVTGTSTTDVMSQKAVSDQLIGVGQTWQDVKSIRVNGTTYTNTTGRPIQVALTITNGANLGGNFIFVVNEVELAKDSSSTHSWSGSIFAVVPDGATYRLSYTIPSAGNLHAWAELR